MEKNEAKAFDKIIKENLAELFLSIVEKWLGIHILKSKVLPEKIQVTLEREPDFVRIIETDTSEQFILHLEFQSTNEPDMVYRQAEYKAILQKKYKLTVRQFVIYLGNQRPTMRTELPEAQRINAFELWNIQEYDYRTLVLSDVPEEIVFAVLGDFKGEAPEKVIRQIAARLQKIMENKSQLELEKYIRQLNVLSGLRKLQILTAKITEAMPIQFEYDIETDRLYKLGVERERQFAQQERQLAQQQKKQSIIKMLLHGSFTVEQIAEFQFVSVEEVLEVKKELD